MNAEIKAYLEKYPAETIALFQQLRLILFAGAPAEPQEILWAKLPSYYVGEFFVRLIPFRDHINIEAKAVSAHLEQLNGYKVTPKGMLQIFLNQQIPTEILRQIFAETLG